jgi:hypothetical protein
LFIGTADELMMAQVYSMKTAVAVFHKDPPCALEGTKIHNENYLQTDFHKKRTEPAQPSLKILKIWRLWQQEKAAGMTECS